MLDQYTVNKKKKKKREKNAWTIKTIFAVGHPSSS